MAAVRTMLVWCPDWPVVATDIVEGVPATGPVAVLRANRVVACSEAARGEGVRRGLRRREAQHRCPGLTVVEYDADRDARAFEQVVAAVEAVAAGVEVVRPGACALAARGPARYFGGEERAAERIVEQVAETCGVECQVGVAEGVFAAGLAARSGLIVPPGRTTAFLAGVDVTALDRPQLTDLLRRLGIRTLGDFAALPAGDVLSRFGFEAALAHRLAAGQDSRPLAVRRPPPDLEVYDDYEDPLERVDVAAFAARALAERLHERLGAYGLACTRLGIEAVTAHGEQLHRVWRHDGLLTAAAIADRVRWQLDGWLSGTSSRPGSGAGPRRWSPRPTSGIVRLRLVPDGVLRHLGLQPGLWGESGEERERAHRALSRVQGILGPEAVVTAVVGGGRSPADQVRLVPWGDERLPARPGAGSGGPPVAPGAAAEPPAAGPPAAGPPVAGPGQVRPPGRRLRPVRADGGQAGSEDEPGAPAVAVDAGSVSCRPGRTDGAGVSAVDAGSVSCRPGRTDGAGAQTGQVDSAGAAGGGARADRAAPTSRAGGSGRAGPAGQPPWPGRLPPPSPAAVLPEPLPAMVYDAAGEQVGVSARLEVTAVPARLVAGTGAPVEIVGWAGPWPVDERWWSPVEGQRLVRFQVALADGRAMLLALSGGRWRVEALYD